MHHIAVLKLAFFSAGIIAISPVSSAETFRDCADCPQMVVIPAGTFTMGSNKYNSERPPTLVTIPKAFAIDRFEVTFDDWDACVRDNGCKSKKTPSDRGWGKGKRPVIYVTWHDAQEYIAWLNTKVDDKPYRLPTEAEWEYAARGDDKSNNQSTYGWGNFIDCSKANFNGGKGSDCDSNRGGKYSGTQPVGSYAANKFGLFDMHGNVWEWTEDCWHRSYKTMPDKVKQLGGAWTAEKCIYRVVRGGSWLNDRDALRSTNRSRIGSVGSDLNIGFRVVRSLP